MTPINRIVEQFTDEIFSDIDLNDLDAEVAKNNCLVTCLEFGNHLMERPIADRLTDAERQKIIKMYRANVRLRDERSGPIITREALATIDCLEHIFGKEMFRQEGTPKNIE